MEEHTSEGQPMDQADIRDPWSGGLTHALLTECININNRNEIA